MPTTNSVHQPPPTSTITRYEAIIEASPLLARLTRTYNWSADTRRTYVGSLSATLSTLSDWRLDKIRSIDERFGLRLTIELGGRVLDAGSGSGALTIAAKRSGINICGVEMDPACLDLARKVGTTAGFSFDDLDGLFVPASVTDLPFPSRHFSLITCHQVIEHVDDVSATLREFERCLAPGGLLWIDAPDYRFCFEPHYRIPWLPFMDKRAAPAWLEVFDKPTNGLDTFHYVSLPQCVALLESLGMETLTATTTTPLDDGRSELKRIMAGTSVAPDQLSADDVRRVARRCQEINFEPSVTSLLVLARKPK